MRIDFDRKGEAMPTILARFNREYEQRVCFEDLDYDAQDAVTLGQTLRDLGVKERAGTLTPSEKDRLAAARRSKAQNQVSDETLFDVGARYSGHLSAGSLADFLTQLTRDTAYDFRQVEQTWVVLPRGYSRLSFPVTLKTDGLSVEQAARAIVEQRPGPNLIDTWTVISGPQFPGMDPTPWLSVCVPPLELKDVPALDALCRISAAAYPRSAWFLEGYKTSRMLSIYGEFTPVEQTIRTAQLWLYVLDGGNYTQSWSNADEAMRTGESEADWQTTVEATRRRHGTVQSRRLRQVTDENSLQGKPAGAYRIMQFDTVFSRDAAVENVTLRQGLDGQWRTAGYFLR